MAAYFYFSQNMPDDAGFPLFGLSTISAPSALLKFRHFILRQKDVSVADVERMFDCINKYAVALILGIEDAGMRDLQSALSLYQTHLESQGDHDYLVFCRIPLAVQYLIGISTL